MVAATYVRDIDASRAFYELIGLTEKRAGTAPTAAWSELSGGGHAVLLVSTQPRLELPALPLLFYFFVDDLAAVGAALGAAGQEFQHVGHPDHARGGELRIADPDGNTVLIGQRAGSGHVPAADEGSDARFSLLREAAAVVAARGGLAGRCQVSGSGFTPCGRDGEVKLADAAGDTVWACISHAEEILVSVPGAFIVDDGNPGIAAFLAGRRS